jgi:hypothetical protein
MSTSPSFAATAKPPLPSKRAISVSAAPRSPRPGVSNDTASSKFVFPAPFSPVSSTNPDRGSISAEA